jgi:hypothetical protein
VPIIVWPSSAASCSEDRYAGRRRREALATLEEELRIIRALRLSGFFLLHRDMLRAGARGRGRGAGL